MTKFTIHSSRRRFVAPVLAVLLLLAGAVVVLAATAPPNIDFFAESQGPISVSGGGLDTGTTQVGPATSGNILGSYRDIYARNVTGSTSGALKIEVVGGTPGVFNHSLDVNVYGDSVITYDGNGGGFPSTNSNGLCTGTPPAAVCTSLTQLDTLNGFRFRLNKDDQPMNVRIKIYEGNGSSNCTEATLSSLFPGGITTTTGPKDIFLEFAALKAANSGPCLATGGADFTKVGAVEFEFIGFNDATDMQIEVIDIGTFDWGDLPENATTCLGSGLTSTYATTAACEGPRHVTSNNLYMGLGVDPSPIINYEAGEQDGQPISDAADDDRNDSDEDDEDGVVPHQVGVACSTNPTAPVWSTENGGSVKVTWVGSGRLVGWIDFDGNGFQISEAIINTNVNSASSTLGSPRCFDFAVPAGSIQSPSVPFYARFRLFPLQEVGSTFWPYAFDGRDGYDVFADNNPPLTPPGQSKNGEVEDYVWYFNPTAISLSAFFAEQMGDYVRVTWETASELDNLGFNLYRGLSPDEPDRQLNDLLIPSQSLGNPGGFTYTWDDHADLVPGTTYYYWVEDVDVNNVATRHGPVSVDFIVPTAVTLGGLQASPVVGGMALPALWVVAAAGAALGLSRVRRR